MSRAVKFLYLTQEQVIKCGALDMVQTIEAVEKAFRLLDEGECIEPHTQSIRWNHINDRRISIHPAYIGGDVQVAGIKWIPSNPENPIKRNMPRANALTILNDPETGFPLTVMDGTVISAMRTGAVVGVGAKYLARPDAEVVGLIGAGVINRTQLMALHAVLKHIRLVKLFDIAPAKAHAFSSEMGESLGLKIQIVDSARAAVDGADVIGPATNANPDDRYIQAEWIKQGAYLANLSINDYTFDAVLACDKIVVDNMKQLQGTEAVIADMVTEGLINPDDLVEFGAIVNGKQSGRTRDDERIFFSPLGMGIEDLINAHRVYHEARRRGIGQELELWHEPLWT
jgi:2,3-diaminopropionate biosynthesis protein SbnB